MLAHLQIIKNKKEKVRAMSALIEGPFFYNRDWSCFDPAGDKLFSFKLMREHKVSPAIYPSPEKLLAISDIEGNFNALQSFLKNNGIVDSNYNWTYGNGHLVLVGDFVDRGNNVTQVLWLIYKLEE